MNAAPATVIVCAGVLALVNGGAKRLTLVLPLAAKKSPEGRKTIWPLLEAPGFENVAAGTLAALSGALKNWRFPPSSPTAMPPAALMAIDRTLFAGTSKFGVEALLTGIVYRCTPPATLSSPTYRCCCAA